MLKKRLDDISILRVFCILIVVFFHCYQMMWAPAHFPHVSAVYKDLYFYPVQCGIINVAMPLFVFISGYLFFYLLQQGKYSTWSNLLNKKGLRMWAPYIAFCLLFMVVTNNWHPLYLLTGTYGHLWFLPMIFWCFIVGYGVCKAKLKLPIKMFFLLIAFCGTFTPMFLPSLVGIQFISRWFYWFYLGMLVYEYHKVVFSYISKYKLYIPLLITYALVAYLLPVEYADYTWFCVFTVTGCILSIIYLMNAIEWNRYRITSLLVKLSSYSFGIYIWSAVGPFLISNTAKQLFGLPELAANHVILFPLCLSILTFMISWGISWGMMKTKVGRFLIG